MKFESSGARIVKNRWNLKVLGVLRVWGREFLEGGTTARPGSNLGEKHHCYIRFGRLGPFSGPSGPLPPSLARPPRPSRPGSPASTRSLATYRPNLSVQIVQPKSCLRSTLTWEGYPCDLTFYRRILCLFDRVALVRSCSRSS